MEHNNSPETVPNKQIKEYAVSIIVAIAIALLLRTFVFARADVEGRSMEATLFNKDIIFVEKISVFAGKIKKGEIIIFDSKNQNKDVYVKRVVAVEGDMIEIREGKVYINGEVLEEKYLKTNTVTYPGSFVVENQKYTIPKGDVFVLGDNRGSSTDSRVLGPINMKDVRGHAFLRVYPFNSIRIFLN